MESPDTKDQLDEALRDIVKEFSSRKLLRTGIYRPQANTSKMTLPCAYSFDPSKKMTGNELTNTMAALEVNCGPAAETDFSGISFDFDARTMLSELGDWLFFTHVEPCELVLQGQGHRIVPNPPRPEKTTLRYKLMLMLPFCHFEDGHLAFDEFDKDCLERAAVESNLWHYVLFDPLSPPRIKRPKIGCRVVVTYNVHYDPARVAVTPRSVRTVMSQRFGLFEPKMRFHELVERLTNVLVVLNDREMLQALLEELDHQPVCMDLIRDNIVAAVPQTIEDSHRQVDSVTGWARRHKLPAYRVEYKAIASSLPRETRFEYRLLFHGGTFWKTDCVWAVVAALVNPVVNIDSRTWY